MAATPDTLRRATAHSGARTEAVLRVWLALLHATLPLPPASMPLFSPLLLPPLLLPLLLVLPLLLLLLLLLLLSDGELCCRVQAPTPGTTCGFRCPRARVILSAQASQNGAGDAAGGWKVEAMAMAL